MSATQLIDINRELFHGAISLEQGDGWVKPWRIPFERRELFSPKPESGLDLRAEMPTGVRIRFETDSRITGLVVVPDDEADRTFDLVYDNELLQTVQLPSGQDEVSFDPLPASVPEGKHVLEIWLAADFPVAVRQLRIEKQATITADPDGRKKWITYGSSITHCRSAHSPAQTWPAYVARKRNLNFTGLGYGGQCHLDGMIARMIRDLPADVITLKLGINMHGGSVSLRTFKPMIISFIEIVREKHPDIPMGVISPILSPPRETTEGSTGYTLEKMREALAYCVDLLRNAGDANLHYFDGLSVFGHDHVQYLPDELHPDGDGYLKLGENIDRIVMTQLLGE